jgi:glucosamine-6-phosphate deaminase
MNIEIMPNKAQMGKAAAAAGAAIMREAIAKRGTADIIVATGASQFEMFEHLVREPDINWSIVTGFHLDEYVGLAITHPASFRRYLWERFASRLPLPLQEFHYLDAEGNPQDECRRVGDIIRCHPIDVAFVGIGENGHLAFNDPPADFEIEEPYIVVQLDEACRRQQLGEGWFPTFDDVPTKAISMSVRQIMKSRAIICTVPDARKAEAVRNSVESDVTPKVPASILQRHERCTLFLDKPAASLLKRR